MGADIARRERGPRGAPLAAAAAAVLLLVLLAPAVAAAAPVHFAAPVYVDSQLAGGEPFVLDDQQHGTLIYTSHEGTTHLYRGGLVSPENFVPNYRNQVNIWYSRDGGRTWLRDNFAGTGFDTNPAQNQGFSDPDLTQDEGGRVYNTGIDLANDALFSSNDGGVTWDRGTAQCHDGDRPWLAGGRTNEVFLATDVQESQLSHQIFQSTDGGSSCPQTGIPDAGPTPDGGSYSGFGKLLYDHNRGRLIEPVVFSDPNGVVIGVGVATWSRGQAAFSPPVMAARTSLYAHWPAIALDAAGNVYLVWDTDARAAGTSGGCPNTPPKPNAPTPVANSIEMAVSRDFGKSFSAPVTIARPPGARVLWPWIAAGDAGKVSVVWYQSDHVADLDCQPAAISAYEAQVFDATSASPQIQTVNAVGRPVQSSTVCQGGTTCVATGQDRRLGDFFTNAIDRRGCVLIATGDTTRKDPITGADMPTALPMFLRQDAGPGLRGADCGAGASANPGGSGSKGHKGKRHRRRHRHRRHHKHRRHGHRAARPRFTG